MSEEARREHIARRDEVAEMELVPGVRVQMMVSEACGAVDLSTALLYTRSGGVIAYHTHECSECITPLEGTLWVLVEGRRYTLNACDSIHVPAGIVHSVQHPTDSPECRIHCTFASGSPTRDFVESAQYETIDIGPDATCDSVPENLVREATGERREGVKGAKALRLFSGALGAVGICGGYTEFDPGTSIACHFHPYDESISIVRGEAVCQVEGRSYTLSNCDVAMIPEGRAHRFLNSSSELMAMVWVYAGDEPTRTVVEDGRCTG